LYVLPSDQAIRSFHQIANFLRHDGALNMKVHINGAEACSANAVYGKEGGMGLSGEEWETISHYTPCKTLKLQPGDLLRVTADYDLRQHKLWVTIRCIGL
jgi:hypothetical protein